MNPLIRLIKAINSPELHVNPPATDEAIRECESALKLKLPRDYTAFLKFANGAELPLSHELFGTIEIDAGIGNLMDCRKYNTARGLPDQFLLFHDDGQDTHAFEIDSSPDYEVGRIIQWDANSGTIVNEYKGLDDWIAKYIKPLVEYFIRD